MNTVPGLRSLRGIAPAVFAAAIAVLLVLAFAGLAHAATNTVTSLADSGAGSLRQVIANSAPGDSIVFGATGTITLGGSELVVDKDLAIVGPGPSALAINGAWASRIFSVQSNVTALVAGLTITNGRTPDVTGIGPSEPGGGICNFGRLWLSNCVIGGNRTGNAGTNAGGDGLAGGDGGGIWNNGACHASRCSFSWNSTAGGSGPSYDKYSPGAGGPGGRGGAIFNKGSMTLVDCAISYNNAGGGGSGGYGVGYGGPGGAGGEGGGIYNDGSLSLVSCTIANNQAGRGGDGGFSDFNPGNGGNGGSGGGIYGVGVLTNCTIVGNYCGGGGTAWWPGLPGNPGCGGGICGGGMIVNDIIALNTGIQGPDVYGGVTLAGTNVIGTDPKVAPLADNGGPTFTMALLPGSPAIDAGDTSLAPATDQRGFPRPAGAAADIGAYEFCYPPILRISPPQGGSITIQAFGTNGQVCCLLSSPDLSNWVGLATSQMGSGATALFSDDYAPDTPTRFYRIATP